MDLLKLSVDVCVMILAERNDVFVSMVWHNEDSVESRQDVCLVPHGVDGSETESDVEGVVAVVELHSVKEDDLEWVEKLELVVGLEQEVGSYCALGSCPQKLAYWTPPCSSSVASSLRH